MWQYIYGTEKKATCIISNSKELLRVYRRGRPVADIVPVPKSESAWKKAIPRLTIPGVSISREILKDRSEAPLCPGTTDQSGHR